MVDAPETLGEWKVIEPKFHNLPVHTALLYNGKVLAFGGSGNDPTKLKNWDPPEIFEPDYSGNTEGMVYEIRNQGVQGDLFCVGHAYLPDGRLFLAGGTFRYDGLFGINLPYPPFWGLEHSYIFDPKNNKFTRLKNMKHGRWYPTCVMMPSGEIATFAGLSKYPPWVIQPANEMYSPSEGNYEEGNWEYIWGGHKFLPLYPRIHLLPNGELFYAGSYNTHMTFPFSLWGFKIGTLSFIENRWKSLPHPKNLHRQEGSTVLLPLLPEEDYIARILLIGGGDMAANATNSIEMIQFSSGDGNSSAKQKPRYELLDEEKGQFMKNKRYYVYPVILPDQNVLVVGGKTGHGGHGLLHKCMEKAPGELEHDEDAVLEAELFITEKKEWTQLAKMKVDRLYHSNAILLQDGRVMTMGSNPMRKCIEKRIELFSPPYLFRGERPKISKVNQKALEYGASNKFKDEQNLDLNYGDSLEIQLEKEATIKSVSLIRPSCTTHCLNPEQRYVGLKPSEKLPTTTTTISVEIPDKENVLPPGYYMLFITNENDVPCVAPFVRIKMKSEN